MTESHLDSHIKHVAGKDEQPGLEKFDQAFQVSHAAHDKFFQEYTNLESSMAKSLKADKDLLREAAKIGANNPQALAKAERLVGDDFAFIANTSYNSMADVIRGDSGLQLLGDKDTQAKFCEQAANRFKDSALVQQRIPENLPSDIPINSMAMAEKYYEKAADNEVGLHPQAAVDLYREASECAAALQDYNLAQTALKKGLDIEKKYSHDGDNTRRSDGTTDRLYVNEVDERKLAEYQTIEAAIEAKEPWRREASAIDPYLVDPYNDAKTMTDATTGKLANTPDLGITPFDLMMQAKKTGQTISADGWTLDKNGNTIRHPETGKDSESHSPVMVMEGAWTNADGTLKTGYEGCEDKEPVDRFGCPVSVYTQPSLYLWKLNQGFQGQ